jgi:hypothetical protein
MPAFNTGGVVVGAQQPGLSRAFRLGFLVVEPLYRLAAIRALGLGQVLQTIRTEFIVPTTRQIKKFYGRTAFVADGAYLHRFIKSNKIFSTGKIFVAVANK